MKRIIAIFVTLLLITSITTLGAERSVDSNGVISKIVQIKKIENEKDKIKFKNNLVSEAYITYVITKDTFVPEKEGTVKLENIKDDLYANIQYDRKSREEIQIEKIEFYNEIPQLFTDIKKGSKLYDTTLNLYKYGIMGGYTDGSFKSENNITRAEIAKIVVSMLNLVSVDTPNKFKDVEVSHWANNYIGIAQESNIIHGNGDGTFAPEDYITNEQTVKMLVCLLGYESRAAKCGDYPSGYMMVANEIGLTRGVSMITTDFATRETIATIANTALNIPLMIQTSYGRDPVFEVADGNKIPLQTIFNKYLNAK